MSRKSKATRQETTVLNPVEDTKHKYSSEEIIKIQEKYDEIKLSFGKHKGKQLIDIFRDDPSYLLWLTKEFRKKPKDEITGTMGAIMKYTDALLDNKI